MVHVIRIALDDKKWAKYSKLKDRHSMTWENLLDVAFKLMRIG